MRKYLLLSILVSLASHAAIAQKLPTVSTFSIVAIDPQTGEMGVAVASRYFSVGSVVPWAMADVGAVATQANVNVGYGQQALDLLRQGLTAPEVLKKILADDKFEGKDGRQVAIVDAKGNVAAYTGPNAPKWAGDRQGKRGQPRAISWLGRRCRSRWARPSSPRKANWQKNFLPRSKPATRRAAMRGDASRPLCWW